MLIDSIILTENTDEILTIISGKEEKEDDSVVSIVVKDINNLKNFFSSKDFFTGYRGTYCFAIHISLFGKKGDEKYYSVVSELLAPFLYHFKYFKINGLPLLFILHDNQNKNDSLEIAGESFLMYLRRISAYLGFAELNYCTINSETFQITGTNVPGPVEFFIKRSGSEESCDIQDFYLNMINSKIFSKKIILIFDEEYSNIRCIRNLLISAENRFKEQEPDRFAILSGIKSMYKKMEYFEIQIKSLQNEVRSRDKIISSSFETHNGGKKVSDFYHHEYEILPLWYKRLGHLIKVILGKRTFRSLFNDNVKKYKD